MTGTADGNIFADFSGTTISGSENPYDALIEACGNDPKQIQLLYQTHREARNQQQKANLLSHSFSGFVIDPVLSKLLDQEANPGYADPRNCLVFWARPPERTRELVRDIQRKLLDIAPSLWLMPIDCLHLTVLEVAHSRTKEEISSLVEIMESKIPSITDHTMKFHARLVKPTISYDAAAIALSFLPAAGETYSGIGNIDTDTYTYHHLRRDIYAESKSTGVEIASRYVVPSSHLTIARFVTQRDFAKDEEGGMDQLKIEKLVEKIEEINGSLRTEHWSKHTEEWQVGEGKGLVCRRGTVWYGGGQS